MPTREIRRQPVSFNRFRSRCEPSACEGRAEGMHARSSPGADRGEEGDLGQEPPSGLGDLRRFALEICPRRHASILSSRQVDPAITARRAFIERFASLCTDDDRIAAVFLSGSYARGEPDRFSDVDLTVVATHGAYDRLFESRWELMEQLGELVLKEDFDGFGRDMLLYLYEDGVDGEVELHHRSSVSWADPTQLVALVDKDDVARDVRAWPLRPPEERGRRAEWIFSRFWRHVWLGSGAVARGRLLTAHSDLEAARVCCVNLARLGHDFTSTWSLSGYDKAEGVLTQEEQARLAPTFGPLEARALVASFAALAEVFELHARDLADRHGLTRPAALSAVVRRRLDEVRASLDR